MEFIEKLAEKIVEGVMVMKGFLMELIEMNKIIDSRSTSKFIEKEKEDEIRDEEKEEIINKVNSLNNNSNNSLIFFNEIKHLLDFGHTNKTSSSISNDYYTFYEKNTVKETENINFNHSNRNSSNPFINSNNIEHLFLAKTNNNFNTSLSNFNSSTFEGKDFFSDNINWLIGENLLTASISFSLAVTMIVLYKKHRRLQNCFTKMFFYLMISEGLFSLGKLMSIAKLAGYRDSFLCNLQANILIYSEIISFIWLVLISKKLYQLLVHHDIQSVHNIRKSVVFSFLLPALPCIALQCTGEYTKGYFQPTFGRDIVWCYIKCKKLIDDSKVNPDGTTDDSNITYNIILVVFYAYYIFLIIVNIYYLCKLIFFIENWQKSVSESTGQNSSFTNDSKSVGTIRKLLWISIISILSYGYACVNRMLQTFGNIHPTVSFWMYVVQIPLINMKGSFLYLTCLDDIFTEFLHKLVPCVFTRKRIDSLEANEETTSEETTNSGTINKEEEVRKNLL